MNDRWLLVLHAAATWALVGLTWTVWVVQYPLFAKVDAASFPSFHAAHTVRITGVVMPLMLVELLSAAGIFLLRPKGVAGWEALVGVVLVGAVWAVTALWSVPMHGRLAQGFEEAAHTSLMWGHGVRTVLWTVRGAGAAAWLLR
ncbi:MAG: hypothetical protein RL653_3831 [Pseudomonadota bacterium]|jgi:hypothetical protein